MSEFQGHIEAAVARLVAGQPEKAHEEIESVHPKLRARTEALLLEYEISAVFGEWLQARLVARVLRRRFPNKPEMVLLLTEAIRHQDRCWESGSILRVAEKRFPDNTDIQLHLIRHIVYVDDPEVALERIDRLLKKGHWWLSGALADGEISGLLPGLVGTKPKKR